MVFSRAALAFAPIAAALLAALASTAAAKPVPRRTPPPDAVQTPIVVPGEGTDDGPGMSDSLDDVPVGSPYDPTHEKVGSYTDATLSFTVPSLGPEWTRISPVAGAQGVRAAFVHLRDDKVRGFLAVTADTRPQPADVAGYARRTMQSLMSPPLAFSLDSRKELKIAGRDAVVVDYSPSMRTRRYEQLYLPLRGGAIVVLTFQAPAPIFDQEVQDFRKAAKAIQLP